MTAQHGHADRAARTAGPRDVAMPPAVTAAFPSRRAAFPKQLGQLLVDRGELTPGDLLRALALQDRQDARLGEILVTHGMVKESALVAALASQWRTDVVDPLRDAPDTRLVDRWGANACLRDGLLPWRRAGGVTVVATCRPELFMRHLPALEATFGPVAQAICTEDGLRQAVERTRAQALVHAAETRVSAPYHCRGIGSGRMQWLLRLALVAVAALVALFPLTLLTVLTGWAVFTLILTAALRLGALTATLLGERAETRRAIPEGAQPARIVSARLPKVSVMIPLFQEEDIAGRLLKRLERLRYPRELTDICLVVEAGDDRTRATLAAIELPRWVRVVSVPEGAVRTKPRALNYALDFCRGSIIGIWDAEDAPAPDQLHKVVRSFQSLGPDVACLQGRLDFYNTGTNWLSRCFTLEYAAWFRVILPGMIRLGFAIPLGGTTLFFRRAALEQIGGWDAHNVTEDADLGIRLARMGYRTEMVDTVTQEEANARALPWIRQRSRWLKGYAITYAVHMRHPLRLLRELGAWRFFGVQLVFLCTLSQFLLAPLLWSFWLLVFGAPHFLVAAVMPATMVLMVSLFVLSELVTWATAAVALQGLRRPWLLAWVPTLHLYFPLGALAAYKAVAELLMRPFFWDKTQHGLYDEAPEADSPADQPA